MSAKLCSQDISRFFLKIYGYWHWRVKNLLVGSEQWTIFSLIVQLSDLFQFTQFCRRRLDGLLLLGGTPSLKPGPFCFLNLVSPQSSLHKVNRCLARYSPRATSQPINRAPNEPAMVRNANFGLNLVVFGQKILFFTGEIKSFVTHITENPPRHLVHIGFWSGIGQNVQKMAIFGP